MARINNIIKFLMINLNIFTAFLGLAFFGFAFYLWFADWGSLDENFFKSMGGLVFLFGLSVMFGSCIGCQGISNQTVKFGFWTGRKIILAHLAMLVTVFVIEVYILKTALSAVEDYQQVYKEMADNPGSQPPYAMYESFISDKFNRFFFGASSECSQALYFWFWNWVDNNCPTTITSIECQACESYSLTFCEADSDLCFAGDTTEGVPYCPYTICREDILKYTRKRILPFSIALSAFAIFQLIIIVLDLLILCYHPRDDLEKILYKSGTLAKTKKVNHV